MAQWSYANIFVCALKLSKRLDAVNRGFPRSVETITDYVLEHLQTTRNRYVPIKLHPRTYDAKAFFGMIEESDSKVDIYYDKKQNRCWRRFIITKELCHLLYATPNGQHLASTPEQIESLLTQIRAGLGAVDFEKAPAASSEQATMLMAIEILLPHSERKKVNKIISDGGDALTVARRYLLPERMASLYLDHGYANFMDKVTGAS